MASKKTRVRVEGLKELQDALADFPKATSRNVLLRTLKQQAAPIASAGESYAPKLTGRLARSYSVSTKLSRSQRRKFPKESPVEVYVGPAPSAKSIQTEFGNSHQAAEPHLRPAWDGNVQRVLSGIRQALAREIEKAAARLARKAARAAAKARSKP